MTPEMLTAITALITALSGSTVVVMKQLQMNKKIGQVDEKLVTSNGHSAGQLVELIHSNVLSNTILLTEHVGDDNIHRSKNDIESTSSTTSRT